MTQIAGPKPIKKVILDRAQARWETLDIEALIPAHHPARVIWELSGSLDLSGFEENCVTRQGEPGRPCWPAQLLVSVWVYSYSIGVASARAIERLLGQEPGLRWLSAADPINYHTLSSFRVGHKEALDGLFAQFLMMLDRAGVVDLHTILQDGTKIKTVAGRGSLHRHKTLKQRLRAAQKVVRELDRRAVEEQGAMEEKRLAAQQRAGREAVRRAQAALAELKKLEEQTPASEHEKLRVSISEAEARNMKQGDGGYGPSYNVQVTTEAQSRIIVGIGVSTQTNDIDELKPAVERVEKITGHKPVTVIADNGYATRTNVEAMSEQEITFIAPWKDNISREAGACALNGIEREFAPSVFCPQRGGSTLLCPAGKTLVVIQQKVHHGLLKDVFEARPRDCQHCPHRNACCGKRGGPRRIERVVESPAMKRYLAHMKRRQTKQLYRKRSEVAEFPHMWIKGFMKWRRFSVRGTVKAGMEALWVALAYNVKQWIRIRPVAPPIAA